MATTVLRNGIDRFKWQRPFTKGKFAEATRYNQATFAVCVENGGDDGQLDHKGSGSDPGEQARGGTTLSTKVLYKKSGRRTLE